MGTEKSKNIKKLTASSYVIIMTCVYPLWMHNGYADLDYTKFSFFRTVTVIFLGFSVLAAVLFYEKSNHRSAAEKQSLTSKADNPSPFSIIKKIKTLSVTDGFVIAYLLISVLSSLFSEYRTDTWWGTPGWYMGLFSQILFCGIYFCISRNIQYSKQLLYPILGVAFIVFIIALLQRIGLDLFNLFKGMDDLKKIEFLSTLGQKTWFSSYVVLIFPFIVYLYLKEEKPVIRMIWAVLTAVISCVICTTLSDSTYVGIMLATVILFKYSLDDKKRIMRLIETGMILFGSFGTVGILYRVQDVSKADLLYEEEPLTMFLTDIRVAGSALIILLIIFLFIRMTKIESLIDKYKNQTWNAILSVFAISVVLLTTYSLFTFNDYWGNHRGFIWRITLQTFTRGNIKDWLIGVGPDMFDQATDRLFHNEIHRMWGEVHLPNAHNEWLNMLLTQGILGFAAYIGIFASSIRSGLSKIKTKPEIFPVIAAVIAYMGHNFFCYQQCIGTTFVFILLGALSKTSCCIIESDKSDRSRITG